jgi:hypothetical protein
MKTLRRVIAVALVVSIAFINLPVFAQDSPPEDVTAACGPGCVLGLLAVGIGLVVMVSLVNFCKKHLPTDCPAPPPHHPADPDTNTIDVILVIPPVPALISPAIDYSDISTNGWTDERGNLFALYFEATLHSSTNQFDWDTHIPLHVYLSFGTTNGLPIYSQPSNAVVVGYNPEGQPIFTNYSGGSIALLDRVSGQQFFRLSVP